MDARPWPSNCAALHAPASPPRRLPGTMPTGGNCRGGRRPAHAPTLTLSGFRKLCCSKRRLRRSNLTLRPFCRAGQASSIWLEQIAARSCGNGRGSAIMRGRATSTPAQKSSRKNLAESFRERNRGDRLWGARGRGRWQHRAGHCQAFRNKDTAAGGKGAHQGKGKPARAERPARRFHPSADGSRGNPMFSQESVLRRLSPAKLLPCPCLG
jgi:hypothetical protein